MREQKRKTENFQETKDILAADLRNRNLEGDGSGKGSKRDRDPAETGSLKEHKEKEGFGTEERTVDCRKPEWDPGAEAR